MKKRKIRLPLAVALGGLCGAFIKTYLGTGFTLNCVTVAVVLAVTAAAFALMKVAEMPEGYSRAFYTDSKAGFLISAAAGGVMMAGALLYFFAKNEPYESDIIMMIFAAFALFAGVSVILLARAAFTGKTDAGLYFGSLVLPLFFSFWLAVIYKDHSTNPVISEYCYDCFAAAAAALSFYYTAGAVFEQKYGKRTVISHLLALYFLPAAISMERHFSENILLLGAAAAIFMETVNLLGNLTLKEDLEED